jgi:hypothetical protein
MSLSATNGPAGQPMPKRTYLQPPAPLTAHSDSNQGQSLPGASPVVALGASVPPRPRTVLTTLSAQPPAQIDSTMAELQHLQQRQSSALLEAARAKVVHEATSVVVDLEAVSRSSLVSLERVSRDQLQEVWGLNGRQLMKLTAYSRDQVDVQRLHRRQVRASLPATRLFLRRSLPEMLSDFGDEYTDADDAGLELDETGNSAKVVPFGFGQDSAVGAEPWLARHAHTGSGPRGGAGTADRLISLRRLANQQAAAVMRALSNSTSARRDRAPNQSSTDRQVNGPVLVSTASLPAATLQYSRTLRELQLELQCAEPASLAGFVASARSETAADGPDSAFHPLPTIVDVTLFQDTDSQWAHEFIVTVFAFCSTFLGTLQRTRRPETELRPGIPKCASMLLGHASASLVAFLPIKTIGLLLSLVKEVRHPEAVTLLAAGSWLITEMDAANHPYFAHSLLSALMLTGNRYSELVARATKESRSTLAGGVEIAGAEEQGYSTVVPVLKQLCSLAIGLARGNQAWRNSLFHPSTVEGFQYFERLLYTSLQIALQAFEHGGELHMALAGNGFALSWELLVGYAGPKLSGLVLLFERVATSMTDAFCGATKLSQLSAELTKHGIGRQSLTDLISFYATSS